MTTENGVARKPVPIDFRNFYNACNLAAQSGVTTVLLTGKGEPTLFPEQINQILRELKYESKLSTRSHPFPIIELQTNGIRIADGKIEDSTLKHWFDEGLRIISISNVGPNEHLNREIYTPRRGHYIDLKHLIDHLHKIGFSIRLATVMIKGGVEDSDTIEGCIQWARGMGVEQLTLRPVEKPLVYQDNPDSKEAYEWVSNNVPTEVDDAFDWVEKHGSILLKLPHGAVVYDVYGQNVCITNCLTESENPDTIRQLIYFPDGHLRYSWQYEGAMLL